MPRPNDTQPPAGGSRPRNRLDDVRAALEALEEQEEDGVHVHVHVPTRDAAPDDDDPRARTNDAAVAELGERVGNIEEGLVELRDMLRTALTARTTDGGAGGQQPPQEGGSAALQGSFQQMLQRAEILVPGFRVPTFDSALPRARTVDAMCATRRQVLSALAATNDGAALIGQVSEDGFDVQAADCAAVATVFNAAAALRAASNNRAATGDRMSVPPGGGASNVLDFRPRALTAQEINERNQKFWAAQEGRQA